MVFLVLYLIYEEKGSFAILTYLNDILTLSTLRCRHRKKKSREVPGLPSPPRPFADPDRSLPLAPGAEKPQLSPLLQEL